MKINQTAIIRKKVHRLAIGEIISPGNFPKVPRNTVNKILNRLACEGILTRLKKGMYSRCKETRFGIAKALPLKALSEEIAHNPNKCFGGLFLFNQLRLTTQVPTIIEILNNRSSYVTKIGSTQVRYVRIRPRITKSTKDYIQTLEIIKKITQIPDNDMETTMYWISNKLQNSDLNKLKGLVRTAHEYPPRVQAILGNLLQNISNELSQKLKKSLNKNSYYHIGSVVKHLKNPEQWNLKP